MNSGSSLLIHVKAAGICLFACMFAAQAAEWSPVEGQLMTRWAAQVTPETAWPEYPRPQMARTEWQNLNGLWDYVIVGMDAAAPAEYDGKILVPFCVESALSGVKKPVSPAERLWYRRSFEVPPEWNQKRVLLNFGAVDWQAEVFVNGARVGEHRGGYTPFSFDITRHLKPAGEQEVVVSVYDPTNTGTQARGKQVLEPQGIWYTAVTGIWQTVWLEPVPEVSIGSLRVVPDIDKGIASVTVFTDGDGSGASVIAVARDGAVTVGEATGEPGQPIAIPLSQPTLWSPENPHLYELEVRLERGGETADQVTSYFGMRKISLGADGHGRTRLLLNNEPYFQLGPLDQGWWPDGLYTAPSDEALRYDIEATRQLGFNMARKHVKVEPARWYYHCDRLGLLVWQDMPSAYLGGRGPTSLSVGPSDADAVRDGVSVAQFEGELREMIDYFGNFPSIVMWVPFNEGWGQYDTGRIAASVKQQDPSRLVNSASGWTDREAGDVYDAHMYPGPGMEDAGPGRATVLGEFGGLGWPVEDHLWWNRRNWGYRTYDSRERLNQAYAEVVGNVYGLLGFGLSAAVYTQTTDVEGEINGLMTYDRAVIKYDPGASQALHRRLYEGSSQARVLVSDSADNPQTWRYSRAGGPGWSGGGGADENWLDGAAPFQAGENPLSPTGTRYDGGPIYIRKVFQLDEAPANLWGKILHRVDTGAVFLNGTMIVDLGQERPSGRHYRHADLTRFVSLLRSGENVIAMETEAPDAAAIDIGLYTLE